jgi:hypothetical protein
MYRTSAARLAQLAAAGALAPLLGCASAPPIQASDSAITVGDRAVMAAVPLAGAPVQALAGAGSGNDLGTYRTKSQNFCPTSAESLNRVTKSFAELCAAKAGRYDGRFCAQPGNPDKVVFLTALERAGNCMRLTVSEPNGDATAPQWVALTTELGYKTTAQRQQEAEAAAASRAAFQRIVASAKAEQERVRLETELPMMKKRGAKVCTANAGNTFVGFVEDWSDEKLKILIVEAFRTNVPSMKLNLGASNVTWASPEEWRLC